MNVNCNERKMPEETAEVHFELRGMQWRLLMRAFSSVRCLPSCRPVTERHSVLRLLTRMQPAHMQMVEKLVLIPKAVLACQTSL